MSYSLTANYVLLNVYRMNSDRFYDQIRGAQALASVLEALGDKEARKIREDLVKLELEGLALDLLLSEYLLEIKNGVIDSLPENLQERIIRLRNVLEPFKAILLKEIHIKFKNVLPAGVVLPHGAGSNP